MSSAFFEIALDREIAGMLRGEGRDLPGAARLASMVVLPRLDDGGAVPDAPPFSVPRVERHERGQEETSRESRAVFDIERLTLPGGRPDRFGAREPARKVRRLLEIPAADLTATRPIPSGGPVVIGHVPGEEHLHLRVTRKSSLAAASPRMHTSREAAVQWGGLAPAD